MSMDPEIKRFIEEGYRRFPDDVEPVDYHPAGKIVVDRGSLRYAFLEGALFAAMASKVTNGERS
ncbi:hypothetical protein ACWAT4_21480 [Bradyrhizobium manausense]